MTRDRPAAGPPCRVKMSRRLHQPGHGRDGRTEQRRRRPRDPPGVPPSRARSRLRQIKGTERRDVGQEFDFEAGLLPGEDGLAELQRVPVNDDRGQQVEASDPVEALRRIRAPRAAGRSPLAPPLRSGRCASRRLLSPGRRALLPLRAAPEPPGASRGLLRKHPGWRPQASVPVWVMAVDVIRYRVPWSRAARSSMIRVSPPPGFPSSTVTLPSGIHPGIHPGHGPDTGSALASLNRVGTELMNRRDTCTRRGTPGASAPRPHAG